MPFWKNFRDFRPRNKGSFLILPPTDELKEFFDSLVDRWKLDRTISGDASFTGETIFEWLEPDVLRMQESGNISMADGQEIAASRNWIWKLEGENRLHIFYDEIPPRSYHNLDLILEDDIWIGEATHICKPDIYLGRYRLDTNLLTINQKIDGPNKNYALTSIYSRIMN